MKKTKRRLGVLSVLLTLTQGSVAQPSGPDNFYWDNYIGIVTAPDGYADISGSGWDTAITGRIGKYQVFYIPEGDDFSEMTEVWYGEECRGTGHGYLRLENTTDGYVSRDLITPFAFLSRLERFESGTGEFTLSNDKVSVTFGIGDFDPGEHTIVYNPDGWVESIDGETQIWGTDGTLPHRELKSVRIELYVGENRERDTYNLPRGAVRGLYEPSANPRDTGVFTGPDGEIYIVMMNGDGAGGYMAAWSIVDGVLYSMTLLIPF